MAAMRVRDGRAIISVDGCTCPSKTWMIRISASGPRHLPRKSATDVEPCAGAPHGPRNGQPRHGASSRSSRQRLKKSAP